MDCATLQLFDDKQKTKDKWWKESRGFQIGTKLKICRETWFLQRNHKQQAGVEVHRVDSGK
jgi:hypothetical protein